MSQLKISDLSGFLDRTLKQTGQMRKDDNVKYYCPFHKQRVPSRKLEIRVQAPYEWHCWACHAKGVGLFSLLKKLKSPRPLFSELEKIVGVPDVRQLADGELDIRVFDEPKPKESESLVFPSEFNSLLDDDGSFEFKKAIQYAKKRKIAVSDIEKYNIGYCSVGRLKDRIVFPSYDTNNNLNFYSCRSYYDTSPMKYINSEVSKNIIGFENLINFDYPIYLCEGALDAIALKRNAIPLFGKTMSGKLKTAIITSKCPEINIVLDDDALDGAIRIADFLISYGKNVKLVTLQGHDPNQIGFEKTLEQIKKTKSLDFASLTMLKLNLKQ